MKAIYFLSACAIALVLSGCSNFIPTWKATYGSDGKVLPSQFPPPTGYAYDEILPKYVRFAETPKTVTGIGCISANIILENAPYQPVGITYTFRWFNKDDVEVDMQSGHVVIAPSTRKPLQSISYKPGAEKWNVELELLH